MTDHLFHPDYDQPVDLTTCVDRMPGTIDAPCLCREPVCTWPFCCPDNEEDE
jgi:hypothetical protein